MTIVWKIVRKMELDDTTSFTQEQTKRNSLLLKEEMRKEHYLFFLDLDRSDSWKIERRRRLRRRILCCFAPIYLRVVARHMEGIKRRKISGEKCVFGSILCCSLIERRTAGEEG
jgi:hypothetical protein